MGSEWPSNLPPGNSASKWQKKDSNPPLSVESVSLVTLCPAFLLKVISNQGSTGLNGVCEDPQYREKGEEGHIRFLGKGLKRGQSKGTGREQVPSQGT